MGVVVQYYPAFTCCCCWYATRRVIVEIDGQTVKLLNSCKAAIDKTVSGRVLQVKVSAGTGQQFGYAQGARKASKWELGG